MMYRINKDKNLPSKSNVHSINIHLNVMASGAVFCWRNIQKIMMTWDGVLLFVKLLLILPIAKVDALNVIRIGGLFDSTDEKQQMAFRYAVDSINSNRGLLAHGRLSAQSETIPPNDSFRGSRKACGLLGLGVAAIFGPQSPQTAGHVQSICDAMEVPHIESRWDFSLTRDAYSINLYPHAASLSKAYKDVLETLGWTRFCIIYENNNGLIRVQDLLKTREFSITLRQLPDSEDYRPLLKDAKKSGVTHIVLDVERENILTVLKQAQQVGMMTSYHNYFFTSLDLQTIDLEDFRYGGTNITALRIVDPENPDVQRVLSDWGFDVSHISGAIDGKKGEEADSVPKQANHSSIPPNLITNTSNYLPSNIPSAFAGLASASIASGSKRYLPTSLTTEVALMYDAVHLFAKALDDLDRSRSIDVMPLECDKDAFWGHGASIVNYMNWVQINGLTGLIKFDEREGFRKRINLDIIELWNDGLHKVGEWDYDTGANYTRSYSDIQKVIAQSLQNKTLKISTILASPYSMLRETSEQMTGNDRYEGFCIDLIQEISKLLKFKYKIKLAHDSYHGNYDQKTRSWTGMVGELLDETADLAIGDLTITYEREQVVDFTMPWMNLGISILYRKPTKKPPNLFSFLSPLSLDVWLYMATAYLAISVLLFVLARFSPYEWSIIQTVNGDTQVDERNPNDDFSLLNCLWFCIGSLMQQGGDLLPKAVSTRIVAGIWWFFTLIMISSYTANLAAFLTVERMESPIESADDLAKQTKIKYGSMLGGSTWHFFESSNMPTYQRMFNYMEAQRPSVYTKSNQEGVQRVRKDKEGKYAFLMESSSIQYIIERECELTQVGGLLDSKSYGIALPPASPYRNLMNSAILKLQELGRIQTLERRWWKERRGAGSCQDDESKSSSKANELGLNNVGGVFVVLLAGMGLASVVAVCEFVWKSRKLATEAHASLWTEMGRELRCALSCSDSSKKSPQKDGSTTSLNHSQEQDLNGPAYLPMETYGSGYTTGSGSQYSYHPKQPS